MIFESEHKDMTIERRPVFLSNYQNALWCGYRMCTTAWNENVMVQNAIVFVGDLLIDDVLVCLLYTSDAADE